MILLLPFFVLYLLIGASAYTLFEKAKEPGWKAVVPFYNLYVWLQITGRPTWWLAMLVVPILNVFIFAQMIMDLLKSFDKTSFLDYFLGLLFTPFYFVWLSYFNKDTYFEGAAVDLPKIEKSRARDWTDSILFAVVAATLIRWFLIEAFTIPTPSMESSLLVGDFLFVSKVNYGPRIPNTPISFPFAHNTMPLTDGTNSYLDWIKLPYYRIAGFEEIKNNDVVVFNWPADQNRPVDKKENYIKRCMGIHGDTLSVVHRDVHINGKKAPFPEKGQFYYQVTTNQYPLTIKDFNKAGISLEDYFLNSRGGMNFPNVSLLHLTTEQAKFLKGMSKVTEVAIKEAEGESQDLFMCEEGFTMGWNIDNFGPLYIPERGATIKMNRKNYYIYRRAIMEYEHAGTLDFHDEKVFLDGQEIDSYTFKMDYYFMMGDNRHNSSDSRMWGFVPEDHVVGKALFVWFSWDKYQENTSDKIRWERFFKGIE